MCKTTFGFLYIPVLSKTFSCSVIPPALRTPDRIWNLHKNWWIVVLRPVCRKPQRFSPVCGTCSSATSVCRVMRNLDLTYSSFPIDFGLSLGSIQNSVAQSTRVLAIVSAIGKAMLANQIRPARYVWRMNLSPRPVFGTESLHGVESVSSTSDDKSKGQAWIISMTVCTFAPPNIMVTV